MKRKEKETLKGHIEWLNKVIDVYKELGKLDDALIFEKALNELENKLKEGK